MGLTWSDNNKYTLNDDLVKHLWNEHRVVPVLPIPPCLGPLQVLIRDGDAFRILGNLADICVEGEGKRWLQKLNLGVQDEEYVTCVKDLGSLSTRIDEDHVAEVVELLVGKAIGEASGLATASTLDIKFPNHAVSRIPAAKWEEVMQHFKPNLKHSIMGRIHGGVDLFIVQSVVSVPSIEISSSDSLQEVAPQRTSSQHTGNRARLWVRKTEEGKYELHSKDKMMPVAFQGRVYKYDKDGFLRRRSRTSFQADSSSNYAGASTSASSAPQPVELGESSNPTGNEEEHEDDDVASPEEDVASPDDDILAPFLDGMDWVQLQIYPAIVYDEDAPLQEPDDDPGGDDGDDGEDENEDRRNDFTQHF